VVNPGGRVSNNRLGTNSCLGPQPDLLQPSMVVRQFGFLAGLNISAAFPIYGAILILHQKGRAP